MERRIVAYPIGHHRMVNGMTQAALAERIGVTINTVSRWETGKACPSVQKLMELADIFDCSIDSIFLPGASAKGE